MHQSMQFPRGNPGDSDNVPPTHPANSDRNFGIDVFLCDSDIINGRNMPFMVEEGYSDSEMSREGGDSDSHS